MGRNHFYLRLEVFPQMMRLKTTKNQFKNIKVSFKFAKRSVNIFERF